MKTKLFFSISLLILTFNSCTKVPITNRRQFNLLPESELMSMSLTEYNKFLATHTLMPASDTSTVMVKRIGANISNAIVKYLGQHKQSKRVAGYRWAFNLVQDKTVNAWCMPGGKVVVYTGLLPVTRDEKGLAVVMGHEIAHAIARHGNERMSQQLAIQLGGIGLSIAISQKAEATQQIFMQSYGISTTLGALAYSRKHESEADKLGLCFMAMAGYDPTAAVSFWERMSKEGGGQGFVLLSTHPSDTKRIADIKAYLPTAMKYYNKPGNTKGR
ncbi:MAG: M48 family metallopeptidase [Bacteroidota bacterium]|nr:M48 family metallopeptidase [Bacteroidota bacterium]